MPPSPRETRTITFLGRRTYLVIQVLALAVLWMLLSGKTDPLHVGYGVLSIALVVLLTRNLIPTRRELMGGASLGHFRWDRALVYPFWFLIQLFLANIHVAKIILSPSMPLAPAILRIRFPVESSFVRVTLGNSITLTPGTFTVRIRGEELVIHALDLDSAGSLLDGGMQRTVAAVFGHDLEGEPHIEVGYEFEAEDRLP